MASTPPTASPAPISPPAPPSNATAPNPAPAPPSNSTAAPPPSSSPPHPDSPSAPPPAPAPSSPSPPSPAPPTSPATSSPLPPPPPGSLTPSPPPPSSATPTPPAAPSHSSGNHPPPSPASPPSSSSSVPTGAVVGITAGVVAVLLVMGICCFCCFRKKKEKRYPHHYGGGSLAPPPPPSHSFKDDHYGGDHQHHNWQYNAPPAADHAVKIASHPSPPSHQPGRFKPPPPPPFHAVNIGSGGSGSYRSGSDNPYGPPSPAVRPGLSHCTFTYEELSLATNGFSKANLLGQGGFGYVHKGLLPNGKEVAVKQLKSGSGQGEREFQAEVETITRVHHRHLVSLVGYCISGGQRLLVYEFVPNNTLEFHLYGNGRPTMDWPTRLKIALDSAKGLAYLHEDCHPSIIHRDIKAANILLDFNFEAKVADFGLAKFAADNDTHVSTRVMGTFGYLAPEYASTGKLSDKSDVFSFGVMLLELITGRRPVDSTRDFMDDSLVDWARPLLTHALEEGNYDPLIDPRLDNNYNHNEMARMVSCAAASVRHSAKRRPRMSKIVRALEGDVTLDDLNEGVRPGHSRPYHGSQLGSSDYEPGQYKEDMKKFRKTVMASQDHTSSEYSAGTSEYGLNPSCSSNEGRHTRETELGGDDLNGGVKPGTDNRTYGRQFRSSDDYYDPANKTRT